MTKSRLELNRSQILAHRRRVGCLDLRAPKGKPSLRRAAWAGLQDSMPRAALLSIHARVEGTEPTTWEHPSLIQIWGPRFSAYVVSAQDLAIFTLGRLPGGARRDVAQDLATRLDDLLQGGEMSYADAGRALGEHPNRLRYAAPTGRLLIRWEGARRPTIRTVPPPDDDPAEAGLELARRYLHVFGPTRAEAFGKWAGIGRREATETFDVLRRSMTPVRTPIGDGWILSSDEPGYRADPGPEAPARLLPSGDPYFLLWGDDRDLLVPTADARDTLWTARVWPGALLVDGEIVGTWRRAHHVVSVETWRPLATGEREAVEAEVVSLPLPGVEQPITVEWTE